MKKIILALLSLTMVVASADSLFAAKKSGAKSKSSSKSKSPSKSKTTSRPSKSIPSKNFPSRYTVVRHGGVSYNMAYGRYYRLRDDIFSLAIPPIGLRISLLPDDRISFRYNRGLYYSYGGVIYRQVENEYEVVAPEIGMIVPEIPEINVSEVTISGITYYEYDSILYKPLPTKDGIYYEVVGQFD